MKKLQIDNIANQINSERIIDAYDYVMNEAKTFGVLDYAVFKTGLMSFGILLGITLFKPLKKFKFFFLAAFLFSEAYMLYRIFKNYNR